jgi:hypothetical protein
MHVLYFLLKKLMEPPFSEYLVLLKNRVTFSYSFIFNIEKINFVFIFVSMLSKKNFEVFGFKDRSDQGI